MNMETTSYRRTTIGSDRNFGLVFACILSALGLAPWVFHDKQPRWWFLGIGVAFGVAAFIAPRLLSPLNRLWFRLGLVMHQVVSPVVMAVVYYFAVVPMGLSLRILGKDLLRLRRQPHVVTYWIYRERPAPAPRSMGKQF